MNGKANWCQRCTSRCGMCSARTRVGRSALTSHGSTCNPDAYENQPGVGTVLDINPLVLPKVRKHQLALYITEGIRKGDALASLRQAVISLYSVWNWRGTDESGALMALADWEEVPVNEGRLVYVVFDSDVMTKHSVKLALERLGKFLERRVARLRYVYLPDRDDGGKQGVDDFLAAGNTL